MPAPASRRGDVLAAVGVALGVFAVQLPFRLVAVNLIDEGAIFQFADELLRGKLPYVEVMHPAFPGVHYAVAAVFALFGSSFETGRTFGAAVFAMTTAVAYLVARWWTSRRGALAVVLLFLCYRVWAYPHWHMVSYSSLAVALILAAVYLAGEALARPRAWPLLLAGLLAGLALVTKQDSGPLGATAIGLGLLAGMPRGRRIRAAATFSAPALAVVAAAAIAAIVSGVMPELIRATVVLPMRAFESGGYQDRPALWPFWRQDPLIRAQPLAYLPSIALDVAFFALMGSDVYQRTSIVDAMLRVVYHLPWVVLLVSTAIALWRRARGVRVDPRETLLLIVGAAFVVAFNPPRDWIHLLVLYPPTLLLAALCVHRALAAAGRWRRAGVLVAGTALGVMLAVSIGVAIGLVWVNPTPVHGPRGTIYATPPQADALQALVDAVGAMPPDLPMLGLPYHPGMNYITGRTDLARYYAAWPAEPDLGRTEDFIRALEARPDGIVVYTPSQVAHFPRMGDYTPALFAYLADHYEIAQAVGGDLGGLSFFVLARRDPPGGTSLGGERLAAAAVTLTQDGVMRPATPGERGALVREALWPFCRAIGVGVQRDGATALRYRVTPDATTHLRGSFGVNPDHWTHLGHPLTFTVAVEPIGGSAAIARRETVDVFQRPADRAWHPLDVDLGRWVGQPVDVVVQVEGPGRVPIEPIYGGFCDLRLEEGALSGAAAS